jgi:hypothetical protein
LGLILVESIPSPVWVRVWGVAVSGNAPLVLRLERGGETPFGSNAKPWVGAAELRRDTGAVEVAQVTFDEDDSAFVSFASPASSAVHLRVTAESRSLVDGALRLQSQSFREPFTFQSSVVVGQKRGPFEIEVRVVGGRLVLGRVGVIEVRIRDANRRPLSVPVVLDAQGLTDIKPSDSSTSNRDDGGRVRFTVKPTDWSVSLRLYVAKNSSNPGEFVAEVPADTAQFWGANVAGKLEVHSLLPISSLYYALVNEQGIWKRGRVELVNTGSVERVARLAATDGVASPRWLIVGREPSLDGASSIGWPLDVEVPSGTPSETLAMRERLFLDGKITAIRDYRRTVALRTRRILVGFVSVAVLFLLTVFSYLWQAQRQRVGVDNEDGGRIEVPVRSQHLSLLVLIWLTFAFLGIGFWVFMRASAN